MCHSTRCFLWRAVPVECSTLCAGLQTTYSSGGGVVVHGRAPVTVVGGMVCGQFPCAAVLKPRHAAGAWEFA